MTGAQDAISPRPEYGPLRRPRPLETAPPPGRAPPQAGTFSFREEGDGLSCCPVASDVRDGVVHGVMEQGRGQPRYSNNDGRQSWQHLLPLPPQTCASLASPQVTRSPWLP